MKGSFGFSAECNAAQHRLFALQEEGAGHRGDEGGPVYVDVGVLLLLLPHGQVLGLAGVVGHNHVILGRRGLRTTETERNHVGNVSMATCF